MLQLLRSFVFAVIALGSLLSGDRACAEREGGARWIGLSTPSFDRHTDPAAKNANAIAQDGTGFLWLATQSGLVRWDGYAYRKYQSDPELARSLPDSFIVTLHADERGRLWVGTGNGGLARFDPASDDFERYPAGPGGLKAAHVSAIAGDGRGGLWVGSSGGLDHIAANDVLDTAAAGGETGPGLPEGGVNAVLQDRAGATWVGTPQGLFRRVAGASRFSGFQLRPSSANNRDATVEALFEDGAGRIWVGTRGEGVFVVDKESVAPVRESGGSAALSSDTVALIVEAIPGEVWLGTYGSGIVMVGADGSTRRIRHQPNLPRSLIDDEVVALFRDRSGLLWVGSADALSHTDLRQRTVLALHSDGSRPESLRNANVSSVLARPDGRVWLGVGSEGIDIFDPWRGRVGQLRSDATRPRTAMPKARVLSMISGSDERVYIGTHNGLYVGDSAGRGVDRVEIPGRDPAATVWSLCYDEDGLLWAGGFDGVWALDIQPAGRVRVVRHVPQSLIGAPRVVSLQPARGHGLWIGTDRGLAHLETRTGVVETVPSSATDPAGLPAGWLSSMLIDGDGRLWLSSFGNGVFRLEGRDSGGRLRFRRLGVREGLPDAGVDKLLADAQGRIWASTDGGLAVIDTHTLAVRALRRAEGLNILAHWTDSGAVASTGELLFGGQGGLNVVRPEIALARPAPPSVVVTDARVGALAVPVGRFAPTLESLEPLRVPPEARGFWLEFATLDFSAPEMNQYAYRLRGFDADWVQTDATHRRASYTNLPPGNYTLQLRGSNRDGVWNDPPLELPVTVLPAWYQTTWYRAGLGLCALMLVAGLVQARTVYLRLRQRELEALVAQRTADLQRRSEELRESQARLEEIAYADPLTGLPNRRLFADELRHQAAQAQRGGSPFVLLLIDLDGFKGVNDRHGHSAGDALLVAVASRLRAAVREADRVARMGGDEFAVLLTQDPGVDDVEAVCRRIVGDVGEPVPFEGASLRVGASIGIATGAGHDLQTEELYKAADLALYEAKRGGRNTWRWHGAPERNVSAAPVVADVSLS